MSIVSPGRIASLIGLALLLGLAAAPPSADAYIYWLSYDSGNSRVGRADQDGKNPNGALVDGIYYGSGVATDGAHVYWGESGSSPKMASIGRANADGTGTDHAFLNGASFCSIFNIRANLGYLYWLKSNCADSRLIDRAPSDGSPGYAPVTSAGGYGCGIATDATYVYWSQDRFIGRAFLDGSSPNANWLDTGMGFTPCAVAVGAGHVYWTVASSGGNAYGTTIGRAAIGGGAATVDNAFISGATFFSNVSTPSGLAVDGNFIYWTNQPAGPAAGGVNGSIGRARLDGTEVDQALVPTVFFPVGLDVDSTPSAGPHEGDPPGEPPPSSGPPAPDSPVPNPSGPARAVAIGCAPDKLILTDVFPKGGKTRFLGVAPAGAAGETVTISSAWNGKRVATPTVGPDLTFTATAPLPPRRLRKSDKARYVAKFGSQRSLALKFARRLYTTAVTISGRAATFSGTVVKPLAKPVKRVAIRASASCSSIRTGEIVARVKPSRTGAFTARFDLPDGESVVYLRAETKVRNKKRSKKLFDTFTLIRGVRTTG